MKRRGSQPALSGRSVDRQVVHGPMPRAAVPSMDDGDAARQQVNDFANFALEKLNSGQAELRMDELYDMWRRENPDPTDYANNVAAVQVAIDDFKAGDRGRPAGELTRELRKELDEA